LADAAGAGVAPTAGATGRTPNAQQRETPASSSVKAGGPMANTAADTRRGADLGASPATRRIAAAAAQNVAANSPTPAIGASSDETTPRAVARGAAQTPPPAQATNSDRSNGRDRTAGNQREAGDRAGHPGSSSVTTLTDAAIRSASQNAGTNGRDSQSGPGPFNAPAPATPPSAVAAPSAATVMFGVDGGSLAPGSGPALAAPQATSVDSTMWSSTETLPDSTVNQIVQAIRLQWANGTGEARITLEPEQFGDVTVSVRVERGQVSARVEADAPVVREWLQSNQQTLRHNLAEQNLKLDRLEVAAPPASRDTDRRDGGRQRGDQPPPRRQRQPQGQETFEVVA
jgi:flagellar hook-length control protein FliK